MTFPKACFVSISIHALLFGCAVAVAGYASGAVWIPQDVMVVSLAGPGPDLGAGVLHGKKHDDVPAAGKPAEAARRETTAPASFSEQSSLEDISNVHRRENDNAGDHDADVDQKEQGTTTALGSGTSFGLISAEQWAVIGSAIERSKNYPRMARERGIQGVVHVRFKLRPSGDVDAVEIVKSSGHDVLDSASISTVYRAAPMPYVNGWVEVPIAYVLK